MDKKWYKLSMFIYAPNEAFKDVDELELAKAIGDCLKVDCLVDELEVREEK